MQFCNAWAIDERSPYVLAVLRHALPYCLQAMVEEPVLRSYLLATLLPWSGLHEADVTCLQPMLHEMPEQVVHFGHIDGPTSALILDFGAVVVVQVSELSEACYIYGKRNFDQLVPDLWRSQPFTVGELAVPNQVAKVYHKQTWEKDVAEILTLCDIRPTYKATS